MIHQLAAAGAVMPHVPSSWQLGLRILIAALLASFIGVERELTDHPSGLRTHIAVAVGAALFGITSAYAFHEFVALRNDNNYSIDPTRIAAQVVTGIGFLGGGAIIKQGNTVRGLTSAAGLWVSAAVGLAVGLGMYFEAITSVFTLLVALVLLRRPRTWLRARFLVGKENVVVKVPLDADTSGVIAMLEALEDCVVQSIIIKRRPDDGLTMVEAEVEMRGGMVPSKVAPIEGLPGVMSVEVS